MVELPQSFRAPRWLQRLNILAVAAALAACTGVILAPMNGAPDLGDFDEPAATSVLFLGAGAASALSTFVFALVWARLLRIRDSWIGWALCIPLAALTAATACTLCSPSVGNFVLGATLGAFIWVPALVMTLVFFGLPIYLARAAAEKGMSSEDRGEAVVGAISAILATGALWFATQTSGLNGVVCGSLAAMGAVAGGSALTASLLRDRERRLFLAEVRAGRSAQFRILEVGAYPMVVRVSEQGHAYRGSTVTEPVVLLDESGDVRSRLSA